MTKTLPKVLADYKDCLNKISLLEAEHASKVAKLTAIKAKIRQWLSECPEETEVHEWLVGADPAMAWKVSKKSDGLATRLHMLMDDVMIPEAKRESDESVKPMKDALEAIENWSLAQLIERGAKNFKTDDGTASLRTDVKYQIADKVLFVDWAVKNGAESELTITLRPNSKFMAAVVDRDAELPSGVSSFREQKCVFTKA